MTKEQWKQNKLKKLRITRGLTQKQVAVLLHMQCEDRLSHWERGQAIPSLTNLFKLARLYEVSIEKLYL
jgi:transcriptional regulator with XRE-family HTH domain